MFNPAQHRVSSRNRLAYRRAPLLAGLTFLATAWLMSGCILHRRPAIPWATAVQVRPVLQDRAAPADDVLVAPEFHIDLETLAALMVPVRTAPPRPRVAPAPAPTPAAPVAEDKPPAPTIAPQLSTAEFAAAQQETIESLHIAEKNLAAAAAARGKPLTPAQYDLTSKIKGFLKDAREAVRVGDWALARNLAKKAQVLSEELLGSV